jgi:predicted lipoprotein with Yx(FWY)xxD motif
LRAKLDARHVGQKQDVKVRRLLSLALVTAVLVSGLVVSATALGVRASVDARAVVKTAFNKTLKTSIVVDGKGRTVYMFTYDTSGKATCEQADPACPSLWPAFTTKGKPQAGPGIKASLLGTTRGARGVTQVTYNRHPLYYFAGGYGCGRDLKPGGVHGQGFYNVWWVVSPKGTVVKTPLKNCQ